jgi:predicted DNA-binding transcriptional regulator AlpA
VAEHAPVCLVSAQPSDTLMKPEEVMAKLGYSDRGSFMRMARAKALPRIRINRRVFRFDRVAVDRWIQRRAIGY